MAGAFKSPHVSVQDMSAFGQQWSSGSQLWFQPQEGALESHAVGLPVEAAEVGKYKLELWYTTGPDYGTCELWIGGKKTVEWDGFNANGVDRKKIEGKIDLQQGFNAVELRITGKNASSKGCMAGIDCYRASRM
jgi:hypothetical protein